jgi:hypothetical protein
VSPKNRKKSSRPSKRRAAGVARKRPSRARPPRAARTSPPLRTTRTSRTPPSFRWNPDPDDVQRSVVKLVLSLIEFIRKLMERQAIRRLEEKTLTPAEIENVGVALMKLEQTVHQIARRFKLDPKDLNLDLGPVGRLH